MQRRIMLISAILIITSLSIFGQITDKQSGKMDKNEQDIKSLAAEFANSVVKRDVAVMERLLADDFKIVSENGRRLKSEFINGFKTPLPKEAGTFEAIDLNHSEVRVYGDTAIMTAKNTHRGKTADGQARSQDNSVTMLAVKKKGQWQIVGLHISRVPDPKADTTSSNEMKNTEQAVMALSRDYADAALKRDTAAIERLLADDFVGVSRNGNYTTKSQIITNFKTPLPENDGELLGIDINDWKVRMYGDTAVMTSKVTFRGQSATGQKSSYDRIYTTVAVKKNKKWQIVASHRSTIPPPKAETDSSSEMKNTEQGIMALAGGFANAIFKRDAAAMDKLLAENFIEILPSGVRWSKIDYMNSFKTPLPENAGTLNMPEMSSPIIRMFGDTAIMSARVTTSGKDAKGEATGGDFLYTMTAVENNGQWQIAGLQSIEIPSRIPPAGMGNQCKFDKGTRAGQTQDYSHLKPLPLGTACQDGRGSTGKLVAP